MGLAAYLARRFANRGQPLDDLVQVASLGLLKAVDRFDPGLGVEFSTYATTTIVGELKRHLRDQGWAVRAPRRMQELYLTLSQVVDTLGQELGRSPNIAELAVEVQASEEEVLEALEAGQAYRFASLDAPDTRRSSGDLGERLGQEDVELDRAEQRATLEPLLERLPPRQRQVVQLRFFGGLTQSEIARRLESLPDAGVPAADQERRPAALAGQPAERAVGGALTRTTSDDRGLLPCGCC